MEKFYIPVLLQNENVKIAAMFPKKARIIRPGEMSESLKQLILTLVGLKPSQVSRFGKERTEAEVSSLAGYVCTNTLKVNCTNIYALLDEYATTNDWELLFGDWQNYPDNLDVAMFLKNGTEHDSKFLDYLLMKGIPKENLSWMDEQNKMQAICDRCKALDSYEEYKQALSKNGLIDDTLLMTSCQAKFYLNCSAKAYEIVGEAGICNAFGKLASEDRLNMMVNFIRVFSVDSLTKYRTVYKQFQSELKKPSSPESALIHRLKAIDMLEKYYFWKNRMIIDESFADDPYRRMFWMKYSDVMKGVETKRFSDHTWQNQKEILIMDFGDYIVTEFMGKAGGYAYLFEKSKLDYVREKVRFYSRNGFKDTMNNYHVPGLLLSMRHAGGEDKWWPDFKSRLAGLGIRMNRAKS